MSENEKSKILLSEEFSEPRKKKRFFFFFFFFLCSFPSSPLCPYPCPLVPLILFFLKVFDALSNRSSRKRARLRTHDGVWMTFWRASKVQVLLPSHALLLLLLLRPHLFLPEARHLFQAVMMMMMMMILTAHPQRHPQTNKTSSSDLPNSLLLEPKNVVMTLMISLTSWKLLLKGVVFFFSFFSFLFFSFLL